MSPDPVFRAEGLAKRFPSGESELVIFENLAFDVHRGERLALVGESGAGKSTLLYLLAGLDRPSSGTIRYQGRNLTSLPEAELDAFRNREIGFVWQSHNLLPEFTAIENVMMPLLVRGAVRTDAAREASERLEEVGLADRAAHRAGELSGGEQQRVSLARALVGNPAVLLSDEPTGNLDFRTGERIFALLTGLQQRRGLTWVLVTHNLSFARRCNRILKLAGGVLAPLSPAEASNEGEGEHRS